MAAFILSLLGGIFIAIGGLATAVLGAALGALVSLFWRGAGALIAAIAFLGLTFGMIAIVGATMINSGLRDKVRTGSILVIVFSIVGGLFSGVIGIVGLILGLVGGILGLTWQQA